jgi:multidrug efflux pump subunit AcrA (membrane-fusion protein)
MSHLAPLLPCRRPELVVCPLGEHGPYVVKDPRSGAYYHLGVEEHFLLTQLDGQRDAEAICTAFAERFGQPLSNEELQEFLDMARGRGFLQAEDVAAGGPPATLSAPGESPVATGPAPGDAAPLGLRILHWRKSLFDPDHLFTWLAPKIGFCWTPAFLVFSTGCIVLASALLWANRHDLAGSFLSALRWETALLAWLVLLLVTTCHEFAHGLTCKRYGGEVHEVGFLLLFFLPCFYCNVSDAWLFKEKSKRLWVTFAGGYFELFLWALAVFVWRLTTPDSLVHYLAFVILTACGVQTLFNFNPLLKLDGYYLLSDWAEVPNLQQRAADYVKSRLRWLLWGAARPEPEPRGRFLLTYGLVSWLYSLAFLALSLVVLSHFLGARLGLLGLAAVLLLGLLSLRGLLHGFTAGEVRNMIRFRHRRTVVWALLLGGVAAALFLIPMEDRASGPFQVRPAVRAELRAPVAGFLREVHGDEGDRVSTGALVARLEVPDLPSRIAQKSSEVREVRARLRLLEVGPRYEEIVEQRRRVERAEAWRDLARQDLARGRQALAEDLKRLNEQIVESLAELAAARDAQARVQRLRAGDSLTAQELVETDRRRKVAQAQAEQAHAQKKGRQALGTQDAETEVARRDKELADARATLTLLEAGSRPEEIEAERARLARLREEVRCLEDMQARLPVHTPVAGLITTPRLREKVGQYVREGELIATMEDPTLLEAEVILAEQDVARVQVGQSVELKARARPFDTFTARVERIAPAAGRGEVQSTVTLYGRLENSGGDLRPGMTGHARVYTGRRSLGGFLLDRALRFLRTEFWW